MSARASKRNYIGRCLVCGESDLELVDNHRALRAGKDGGKYDFANIIVCCKLCHAKFHTGRYVVRGRHFSTTGRYYWHLELDGRDAWIADSPTP